MIARLTVRLTPRGGRDTLDGWAEDGAGRPCLKARVAAAPVDGEANASLVKLLAKALGAPKSTIRLVAGQTSRIKVFTVDGLDQAEAFARLGAPVPPA